MSNTATTEGAIADDFNVQQEDVDYATGEVSSPEQPRNAGTLVIQDAISRLQAGRTSVYSTVVGTDFKAKMAVLTAVTNAAPIMENLNKHIELENIVVQEVELTDPNTGLKTLQPRVIFIDGETGDAYYGISPVLLKAVETYLGVLGQPHTWPERVGTKVLREKGNRGFYFFNLVLDPRPEAKKK